MKTSVQNVTPEIAKAFLLFNFDGNRKINNSRIDYYAKQMTNDQWKLTHQGIAFDKAGVLIDGQHRLHAIVQSGKTVPMLVIEDLEHEGFKAMDSGMARGLGVRTGLSNSTVAICSVLYRISTGDGGSAIAPEAIENIYEKFKPQIDKVVSVPTRRKITTAYIMAAVVLHLKEGNVEAYNQYVAMAKFIPAEMKTSIGWLFKKLIDEKTTGSSKDRNFSFLQAFRALTVKHFDCTVVRVQDPDKALLEARKLIRSYLTGV
jgi:hypothetical protein